MGYYCTLTNTLDEASKIFTIVVIWTKYEHFLTYDDKNQLSGHITRQINEKIYVFEFVCAYIDDLLILPRGD